MTVTSASGTGGTSSAPPLVVNGLVSGINTSAVITALLQGYAQPITALQNQQSTLDSTASDYQTLVSDLQAVSTAAAALDTRSQWNLMTASSSDSTVATAQAAAGAQAGSMAFVVNNLAQANVLLSSGSVASEGSAVTPAPSFLLSTGTRALGLGSLGSSSLALGSHAVSVTQSSAAATLSGTALSGSTVITTGSNDTLDVSVNGSSYALTLSGGTYDPAQLASAVDAAASAAGAPVTAAVDADGALTLTTNEQGSAASLGVTGGDAEGALGLSVASATGADAVVDVDGTATTLSSVTAGQTVTLNAPSGTVTAVVGSAPTASGALIEAGTAKAVELSSGGGTLSSVIQAINGSGLGVTATAVEPTAGDYRLQVSANATGLAGSVSLDPGLLMGSSLGSMNEIASAKDASVSVGGAGGYTLTSSTHTFSSILSGTTVTVSGTGPATVTVTPDATSTAAQVSSLVAAANQALSDINSLTAYNAATKSGGPLMGSAQVNSMRQQILSIFATTEGTSAVGNSADVGITVNSTGTLSFDPSKFEQTFSSDPTGVAQMFTQGGSFSPKGSGYTGQVTLGYAGATSVPGSYDVSLSQSATQAGDAGSVLAGGAVTSAEHLTITAGGATATYATSAGESLENVAAGLNAAFAANGLGVTASLAAGGEQLELTADGYGSLAGFSVTTDTGASGTTGLGGSAGSAVDYAGLDVAGTINGVTATGTGQLLSAPIDDPTLNGLSVAVTTPGISSVTDLGTFSYTPGIAQALVTLSAQMTASGSGALSSEVSGLKTEATGLNANIANYQALEASQQTLLQNEFATMESTLGSLKNESSALSGQLSGISANGW